MDIVVPDLGEVGEVQLVRWMVAQGDRVRLGDAVAELEADKAVFVVEAPAEGVLDQIVVPSGKSTRPGELIARLKSG